MLISVHIDIIAKVSSEFEARFEAGEARLGAGETRFGACRSGCPSRMGVTGCMEIGGVLRYAMRAGRLLFLLFLALAWVKEYFTPLILIMEPAEKLLPPLAFIRTYRSYY